MADGSTIYDHPETAFVASFVGENNLFKGRVAELTEGYALVDTPLGRLRARMSQGKERLAAGDDAFVFVRPESLKFADSGEHDNRVRARVRQQEFEGSFWQVFFDVEGSDQAIKLSTVNDGSTLAHGVGDSIELGFGADMAIATPVGELAAE